MPQSRASSSSLTPSERARRSRLLGGSLLVTLLLLLTGVALVVIPRMVQGSYVFTSAEVATFGSALSWLLLGYMCQRLGWFATGGWMLVTLVLVTLSAGMFFFPLQRPLVLLGATIPVALAALLLSFQSVYIVALFSWTSMLLVWWFGIGMPFPLPPEVLLSSSVLLVILTLLAIILAPVRRGLGVVADQMQQTHRTSVQLEERLLTSTLQIDRERVQQQLERRHVEAVMQRINDGVLMTDADGRIVQANRVAQQLWTELFEDELDGRNINVVIARLRSAADDDSGARSLARQIDLIDIGRDDQQQGMGTTYVLLDQRERARLTRLRSELLELLAREMHDPLTSMLTALEMLLGEKNLPDGTDRVLVGARRSGQRLQNLMETLREVNSLEESRDVLRRVPTALRAVIESGIAQTAPQAQQNSVHVVAEYSSDAVLPIDKERLLRAFVNLLYNALRQSPPYSTVNVQTQRVGSSIVVRIIDQGPGLSAEAQQTIFARLSSASDERSGSALGLTFSRLVIQAHGGHIWVESNGGQGSIFAFSLPLEGGKG